MLKTLNKEKIMKFDSFNYCKNEIIKYAPYLTNIPKQKIHKFQIFCDSNFHIIDNNNLDEDKIRICWIHSDPKQNEQILNSLKLNPKPLANSGWNKFHKLVFVSYYQMENWIKTYDIPRSHCVVMKHALDPIEVLEKPRDKIVLVHHANPQRGLLLLVDIFEKLCEEYDNIELKVHSSLIHYKNLNHLNNIEDTQKKYEQSDLYQRLEKHSKIHNIGYLSDDELKKSLSSSHIFAYPNIFIENFCLSLLEAMSAGCLCVHPNYGCLPETSSNWTMMYSYHEKIVEHKEVFYQELKKAIEIVNTQKTKEHLKKQKEYVDYHFNWEKRTQNWIDLLQSLENLPPKKVFKKTSLEYK